MLHESAGHMQLRKLLLLLYLVVASPTKQAWSSSVRPSRSETRWRPSFVSLPMNHESDVSLLCTGRKMDEEDHKAVLVELVYKFLSDRGFNVAAKGVLDLHEELQCPHGDYSRIIASIRAMGARYEGEMDRACADLGLFRKDYATRFQRALSRVIDDGITWGRVLIAFNFTALVAGYCTEHRMDEKVSELVRAADAFMRENCIYEWIAEQGGWVS